jgi:hypothetical protein
MSDKGDRALNAEVDMLPNGRVYRSAAEMFDALDPQPIPRDILDTLRRALVWCPADKMTQADANVAWAWIEARNPYEEMGQ